MRQVLCNRHFYYYCFCYYYSCSPSSQRMWKFSIIYKEQFPKGRVYLENLSWEIKSSFWHLSYSARGVQLSDNITSQLWLADLARELENRKEMDVFPSQEEELQPGHSGNAADSGHGQAWMPVLRPLNFLSFILVEPEWQCHLLHGVLKTLEVVGMKWNSTQIIFRTVLT